MYNQLYHYFDTILSRKQCDFSKVFSVLNSLLLMIEKYAKSKDYSGAYSAVLTLCPKVLTAYIPNPYSQTIFLCFEYVATMTDTFLLKKSKTISQN